VDREFDLGRPAAPGKRVREGTASVLDAIATSLPVPVTQMVLIGNIGLWATSTMT
jgi:hypothetical protein